MNELSAVWLHHLPRERLQQAEVRLLLSVGVVLIFMRRTREVDKDQPGEQSLC